MGTSIDLVPWKSVNGTRGISKAVTLDGVYRPVNYDIIKSAEQCDDDCITGLNNIVPGDRGKVSMGAAEFICTVETFKMISAWVLSTFSSRKRELKLLDAVAKVN